MVSVATMAGRAGSEVEAKVVVKVKAVAMAVAEGKVARAHRM